MVKVNWSKIRLLSITIVLSFLLAFPLVSSGYFPNTGEVALQNFLQVSLNWSNETMRERMPLTWGLFVSEIFLGSIAGTILCICMGSKNSRAVMFLIPGLGIPGYILQLAARFAPKWGWLLLFSGRFFCQTGRGIITVTLPVYLNEVSGIQSRDTMTMIFMAMFSSSAVVGNWMGGDHFFGSDDRWHLAFVLQLGICAASLIMITLLPNSPEYLDFKGRKEDAAASRAFFQGTPETQDQFLEKREQHVAQQEKHNASNYQLKALFPVVALALVITLADLRAGGNELYLYSTEILK